jgi:hypothetical protein
MQQAEAPVAMGLEWVHTEFLGQSEVRVTYGT